jgi:C2 domain./FYVE zinc finger.
MILAQFNDHRNYLSGNKTYSTSFKTEKRFGHARNVTDTGKIIPREDFNCKVIKLQKVDEIHVAPCQCALRLLGMENQPQKGGPSQHSAAQLKSSNVREKRVKPLHNIEEDGNDVSVGEIRHSRTASVINDDRLVMKLIGTYKNTANSMVRTSSARVTSSFISETNMRDQPCTRKGIISTANDASHSRPESNPLNLSEFHEITLIRNGSVTPLGDEKLQCEDLDGEFVEWDAVTIRCSNHDELDLLVKELRDSSKAKVVPFSSNPKYRSRWNRARRRGMESNTSRTKITESHVKEKMEGLITVSTEKISSRDNVSPIWDKQIDQDSTFATSTSSRGDPDSDKLVSNNVAEIKGSSERKTFDSNFNKMQFCELCDLTFTLLTRRHHCRRCERSCCGHCSRILIVKGCDEKRYCNWCASDILQKQSYALRGRLFHKDQDDFLPGKVHDACFRLGVGFTGRLPHWKTFLYPKLEDRPAAGRITIEVIEAIALPSVDMVNGKVDPYVRATITGYDRDMKWTLRQWLQSHRYSLCSRFCSATLSPLWRGTGKLGGELLTLPVISTAGAVLRLEVLHYNVLTTRDKDPVLGVVEIPLSDLPNANLRHPGGVEVETDRGKKRNIKFDGYCDRWYRLLQSEEFDTKYIMLSKPILSPIDANTSKKQGNRKVGMQSLEEVGKRMLGLTIAPVEWLASAIKLDLPARRPEAVCRQHKARSMIHVRLKLNASIVGDVLSHAWFPPVRPFPLPPPYDPEVLLSRILQVGKQTEPYRNIIQHIELCIKWKYPAKVCILSYAIFGFHVAIFPYLLPVFHVYLFIFLWTRLRQMRVIHEDDEMLHSLQCHEAFDGLGSCQKGGNKKFVREKIVESHNSSSNYENTVPLPVPKSSLRESHKNSDQVGNTVTIHNSPSLVGLRYQRKEEWKNRSTLAKTKLSQSSSNTSLADSRDRLHESRNIADNNFEEEVTKLNIAIHWIAKRLGDNKGLEVLQFKLGMLGRDLRNVNSVWNGKNPFLTRATMAYLVISFVLHFLMNQRLLWLLGTSTWYFAQAPFCVLTARFIFGFSRGIAKVMRRQQLLDGELLSRVVA